jgi:hypothetical protein
MMVEIDWLATGNLAAVITGLVTLVVAVIAARYAKRSVRLQERQDRVAPSGIELSAAEFRILRLVDTDGHLIVSRRQEVGGRRGTIYIFSGSNRRLFADDQRSRNVAFEKALGELRRRVLLANRSGDDTLRLTAEARALLRSERDRATSEDDLPIEVMP